MTPRHRRFRRWWWRIVPLLLAVLLVTAAGTVLDPPANREWPAAVPAEKP
jgi:hypothetical protein